MKPKVLVPTGTTMFLRSGMERPHFNIKVKAMTTLFPSSIFTTFDFYFDVHTGSSTNWNQDSFARDDPTKKASTECWDHYFI